MTTNVRTRIKRRPDEGELDYDERLGISVAEAIKWAESLPYLVALYLSDVV
jgi:hypothetical protein